MCSPLGGSGYLTERLQPTQPLTRDNSMLGFAISMFFESDPTYLTPTYELRVRIRSIRAERRAGIQVAIPATIAISTTTAA